MSVNIINVIFLSCYNRLVAKAITNTERGKAFTEEISVPTDNDNLGACSLTVV